VTVEGGVGHQVLARLEHHPALALGAQRPLDGGENVGGREAQLVDVAGREKADVDAPGRHREA